MRRTGKRIAVLMILMALGIAALLIPFRDDLFFAWHGFRLMAWLPEEVSPSWSLKHQLNSAGQVAVEREDGRRGGRWSLATGDVLWFETLPGAEPDLRSSAISDTGSVIGTVYVETNHLARGFIWNEKDGMSEILGLGGSQVAPIDVNERNQVVGWALPPSGPRKPFFWEPGSPLRDLGAGVNGVAMAINGKAWVVGYTEPDSRPFVWKPDHGMKVLPLPAGTTGGRADAINERGEVLCSLNSKTGTTSITRPYLWSEETEFRALPFPDGFDMIDAHALNQSGAILLKGMNDRRDRPIGFLLADGTLRQLPVPPGYDYIRYTAINDRGWILGIAVKDRDSKHREARGFLVRPLR